ncbi:hypothetical protein PR202_gb04211 [Eleusine coracana subsp. coracana]|uniref:Uncharacterized protein n=1 Tax=Eleusine coracana subsp. coracana TaxID=191504 RepID=A0AAV5E317_ELECO|nr:hypothetical protein PR202_gb04211 [Eleusine coracana subsp. coracana]
MEPKRSSSQQQPHAMEPKGKKSSPRGAAAAEPESPLSSLFNPPAQQGANGKDQDLYRILYKGQSGSAQAGMAVHYGGRDYYGSPGTMQATESSNEYKGDKKDPATDSHGDWWQGSFYY